MNTNEPHVYESALSFVYSFYRATQSTESRPAVMKKIIDGLGLNSTISPNGVVQITGTNGKGSCARQVEADLIASGRDVITLTSPHLTSFRERVRRNGIPLNPEVFGSIVKSISHGLYRMRARGIAPTPVEIAFLATLQLRKNIGSHCCLVVEVGRGGATDYTNVFRGAIVGLTRIGHDHLDLFQDLAGVAREKVGLSSSGGLLVSVEQDPVIRCVIEQECRCREITIEWLSHSLVADLPAYLRAWQENRILGNRLAQLIVGPDWRLGRVERRDPWRIERRTIGSKGFILDGGHNPEAVQLLLDSLRVRQKSDWVGIFGLLTRKRYDEIAHIIGRSSLFKRLIVVQGSRGEFVDSHHLGFLVGIPYISASSMQNAIIECLRSDDASVAVFGSFRLAYDFERSLHALGLGETAIPINDIDPLVSSTEPLSFSCASLC